MLHTPWLCIRETLPRPHRLLIGTARFPAHGGHAPSRVLASHWEGSRLHTSQAGDDNPTTTCRFLQGFHCFPQCPGDDVPYLLDGTESCLGQRLNRHMDFNRMPAPGVILVPFPPLLCDLGLVFLKYFSKHWIFTSGTLGRSIKDSRLKRASCYREGAFRNKHV